MTSSHVHMKRIALPLLALLALAAAGSKHLKSMARTCAEICRDCEAECRKHADKMPVCRDCAEACAVMIKETAKLG